LNSTCFAGLCTKARDKYFDKKELRQERAKIITERSKALSPLKKQIDLLESEVIQAEAKLKEANAQLLEASQDNDVDAFVQISRIVKTTQKVIDAKFKELEKLSRKHDEKQRVFEAKLEAIRVVFRVV